MQIFIQFMEKKGSHDFSCIMADFPDHIAKKIQKWEKKLVEPDDLYTKEAENGLETEVHVTVLYGLHNPEPDESRELLADRGNTKLILGKTSIFETPEYDVLKFDVDSNDLKKLNQLLRKNCEYTSSYPRYVPHCTIAYLKKGRGKKYVGNADFQGTSVTVKELTFSSKNGKKTKI